MTQAPITVAGIPLPSSSLLFLSVLACHVTAGLAAAGTGLVAMLTAKAPGRHPTAGIWYYRSLVAVFCTMAVLSALRWSQDYHLFILGGLALAAAVVGRRAAPSRPGARVRVHVTGMGLSYVFLLTAFYVDNGPNLPLWRLLPRAGFWLLPILVGAPVIGRVLLTHPVVLGARSREGKSGGA
ncbi:MAG TPA: hypothetical protein VJN62_08485 [Gemmatimonadales bacterium]|nr:hypothetical protein [Gemmatimonadales bacterium]